MNVVKVVQFLCPERHCVIALAFESQQMTDDEAVRALADQLQGLTHVLNPWCGVCGAPFEKFRFEVGVTEYGSIREATPHLVEQQRLQREHAKLMRRMGRSHDSARWN